MTTINPLEYISVIRRMKITFLVVCGSLLFTSLIFAINWSKYRAYATVEVARPEISMEAIETSNGVILSATDLADLQISRLKQTVLSTSSLAEIIAKLDLYPKAREKTPIAYIAQDMSKKINLKLVSTSLANPASAQKASALQLSAIAFVLSFEYSNPLKAQKTVNELVTRFLDADLKERRKTAQKTSEFLQGQIDILTASLEEQEKKIAEFRAQNGNIRADSLGFNQQAAVTTTSRLLAIESEVVSSLGLIGALRAQLAQTQPYSLIIADSGETLTTPAIQLRALKSQYATLKSKYGSKHPDLLKTSRQIKAIEMDLGSSNSVSNAARIKAQIYDVEAKIKTTEHEYGVEHPDLKRLVSQLDKLEAELIKADQDGSYDEMNIKNDADNPAYLQIVAQLDAAKKQQEALILQRDEIKAQQLEYQNAIEANPVSEQQLAGLTRDYDNMMLLYRELTARKLSADMSKTIEEGHSGHRLAVINPPELPRGTSPSRKIILLAGIVFSVMAGFGTVLGIQLLSQKIIGPKHLENLLGVSPLVAIPAFKSYDEKIKQINFIKKAAVAGGGALVIFLIIFFVFIMPFDVFEAIVSREVGL
ncbi:MAG: GumC family protein [Alphaproteobacteria bacterium]